MHQIFWSKKISTSDINKDILERSLTQEQLMDGCVQKLTMILKPG